MHSYIGTFNKVGKINKTWKRITANNSDEFMFTAKSHVTKQYTSYQMTEPYNDCTQKIYVSLFVSSMYLLIVFFAFHERRKQINASNR